MSKQTLIIRWTTAIILLAHSIPGMLDGGVNAFGNEYLAKVGFGSMGLFVAWTVKLSHIVCAAALAANRWILYPAAVTILILIVGIVMVHAAAGWFVVGGGSNGIEFNLLLIAVLAQIIRNSWKQ